MLPGGLETFGIRIVVEGSLLGADGDPVRRR